MQAIFVACNFITGPMIRIICSVLLLLATAHHLRAQSTARASVSATIVTPISAAKEEDLNFGSFAVRAQPGTIELNPFGLRQTTGGVKWLENGAMPNVAALTIFGGNEAYAVTLPSTPIVIMRKGSLQTMSVGSFTIAASQHIRNTGSLRLAIGATLYVNTVQLAGHYISTIPFPVTVNYN